MSVHTQKRANKDGAVHFMTTVIVNAFLGKTSSLLPSWFSFLQNLAISFCLCVTKERMMLVSENMRVVAFVCVKSI